MQSTEQLLKQHHLRITEIRLEVLHYFQNSPNALTHANIENYFANKFDRVTLYRTLTSFLENGLLHKIPDDTGVAKYALCYHESAEHTHDDHHVHFKCRLCDKIECLHELEIPKFTLPKKYKMENVNLLIEGICANCTVAK